MVNILGEHLIRDNIVGVMELIKNGYDADAEHVRVELLNLSDPESTEIMIVDDGIGMNEATIRGPWSEPAHGDKEEKKERRETTRKGRLPLGEKGVGRFAAQKLGRYLELITRPESEDAEYCVRVDWDEFDRSDVYLDEIGLRLEKRTPVIFTGSDHGTSLRITHARDPWKKRDVEKLQAYLLKLLSPNDMKTDFEVKLTCPEYPHLQQLDRSYILNRFQFKIDCRVDKRGIAGYTFYRRSPDGNVELIEVSEDNIWSMADEDWKKVYPACGPFRVLIYAWLRASDQIKAYGITKTQLSELCGIGIYRDGFRVLPYGDAGDDWLGLDQRRINQPGEKYGNNQVIGMVEINQNDNDTLIDKTNREGLWENQSYSDLKNIVLAVVSKLENESFEERTKAAKKPESVQKLKKEVMELREVVDKLREEKTSGSEPVQSTGQEEKINPSATPEPVKKDEPVLSVPVSKIAEIQENARKVESAATVAIDELISANEDKKDTSLHLMGIGLAAERFTHEFDRIVLEMNSYMLKLEQNYPYDAPVKALRRRLNVLINEAALISAARYTKIVDSYPSCHINEVIKLSIDAHSDSLEKNKIAVENGSDRDFIANISVASLSQVIDNIIVNAVYWLDTKTELDDRRLSIDVNSEDKTVVISDNGSLIPHNIKKVLFKQPFVTSKPNGRGLGLYISSEIMKRYNATINYLSEDDKRNRFHATAFILDFD